jgi:HlyD family secretion protein
MVSQNTKLFRKKALARSNSPERLDQLMQVVSPMNWLPLTAFACLVGTVGVWSVVGRIPITVTGQGVLVYPSNVMPFQSPSAGQLSALNVSEGQKVKKGQVIATISQVELKNQLQQQRSKLAQLQAQNQNANSLQASRTQQDLVSIAQQRQTLQVRLQQAQSLTPILRDQDSSALKQQRLSLELTRQQTASLTPTLKSRLDRVQKLKNEGAISLDVLLQVNQAYQENIRQLSGIDVQVKELDVKKVQIEKSYRDNLSQINEINSQLRELTAKEKGLSEQNFQTSINRQNEIQEVTRNIRQLEVQLNENSQIVSPYDGRILELTASNGQVVTQGTRIATIQAEDKSAKLMGLTFFPVGEGKKVQKNMKVQITPSTVERERFGGIVGKVTDVSRFPISKESALKVIGNEEVVQSLMAQGPQIQVSTEMQPDQATFSKYRWSSSKGPNQQVTPGTTTSVQVTIEERAPINFVFPFLKSLTGVN